MSNLSTHVLDLSTGKPAAGIAVRLEVARDGSFTTLGEAETNADGRVPDLLSGQPLLAETYRITFAIGAYFAARGQDVFYPEAQVLFMVSDESRHHHIPLLLSPFGYSTYRGS
jgi:5-hydroxyisourate hydrolase